MIRVLWLDGSNFLGAIAMHERKDFWDKNAGRYDRFMRNDRAAYEKMYGLIRPVVKEKGSVRPGLTYMCPHGAISLTP